MANTTSPVALDETLKVTNQKLDALKTAIENGGVIGGGGSGGDSAYTELSYESGETFTDTEGLSSLYVKLMKELYSKLDDKEGFFCGVISFDMQSDSPIYCTVNYNCCKQITQLKPIDGANTSEAVHINPLYLYISDYTRITLNTSSSGSWWRPNNKIGWYEVVVQKNSLDGSIYCPFNDLNFPNKKMVTENTLGAYYKRTSIMDFSSSPKTIDLSDNLNRAYIFNFSSFLVSNNSYKDSAMYMISVPKGGTPVINKIYGTNTTFSISATSDSKVVITHDSNYVLNISYTQA